MNVLWMPAAVADLGEIRDFIAADDPERAVSFVNEIIAAGDGIADMPLAFPLEPKLEDRQARRRIFGRYLIFYRVRDDRTEILRVAHAARDYIRGLFDLP